MDEALHFFKVYEVWIYLVLGIGAVIYVRKFTLAWQELRSAIFGLERDRAQSQLNQASAVLVILVMIAVAEFVIVSFVAPMVPGASPLPTPTIDLLATPTTTLEVPGVIEDSPEDSGLVPLPTVEIGESSCVPGEIDITSPDEGDILQGEVEIRGSASIADFGFYKLEVARQEEALWLTIQAGRDQVVNDVLVSNWDTSRLPPDDYVLQLVVVDSRGEVLPACRVSLRIEPP